MTLITAITEMVDLAAQIKNKNICILYTFIGNTFKMRWCNLQVTYSINGENIELNDLIKIKITKKDYIDYVELLKKNNNNFNTVQK